MGKTKKNKNKNKKIIIKSSLKCKHNTRGDPNIDTDKTPLSTHWHPLAKPVAESGRRIH